MSHTKGHKSYHMSSIRGGKPPGLVIERTDDYVDIPFGAVGLYWLKQFLPLVLHHRLRQHREDAGALHHLSGIR